MRTIFYIVKYMPVVAGWLLTIHCALLLNDVDEELLKEFLSFSWQMGVVFTILSYRLHFCVIHRLNIWFDCLMDLCIKAQRYELFNMWGCDVNAVRLIMLVIGIAIQLLLISRMYGCKQCRYESIERVVKGDRNAQ